MNVLSEICKSFNRHAHEYEQAAKIQTEIGRRLMMRLEYMTIQPKRILDLGAGTGLLSQHLKKRYPKALVVSFDLSEKMLHQAQKKQSWRMKWPLVSGDMMSLPFANDSFDLIFSNQVLHWASASQVVYEELHRVLNQNGCLLFSTLGPDSFLELRKAWAQVDQYAHSNEFPDMHDIGDDLIRQHFFDPVMDMEMLQVNYKSLSDLLAALKAQGIPNINSNRKKSLTGKSSWQAFTSAYETLKTQDAKYPLSYEVLYGHAWKISKKQITKDSETFIPVDAIRPIRR